MDNEASELALLTALSSGAVMWTHGHVRPLDTLCAECISNLTNLETGSQGRVPPAASALRPLSSNPSSGGSAGSSSAALSWTSVGKASDCGTELSASEKFVASGFDDAFLHRRFTIRVQGFKVETTARGGSS